jgi:hypothetical protein
LRFLDKYIVFEKRETIRTSGKEIDKITGKKKTMDILTELYVEDKNRVFVKNLLTKTTHAIDEIAALAELPVDFVKEVKKKLRKKKK